MSFIWFVIIGLLAGFIAGKIMRGGGFGWVMNLVIGVVGGLLGGFLFGLLGFHTSSIIGSLITSVVGAVLLLWIAGIISSKSGGGGHS
ncbi:MAG: GlsB/YeaQ/YmgE family stress response membrane protein [Muribaculaceae bacterium]|nr:GlsB/YeaQ/YmgE family stress response membrane protein [Muribaculaceae bacterium]